ncbi:fatty acyl-CoA reductase wat-like isoform X1 [Lycorma delicatula]|uniref:fatty acyl-CoA reductase wat-like isoform X1 n=2 Tax=Lycorma delicatula TaxID=130591 RepID=UPI003F5141EE
MNTDLSETPIQQFYEGETLLITGGTGFLGKVIIEKLMRSCPNFRKIYLIVRSKKDKDQRHRLKEQFDHFIYSKVNPFAQKKVSLIKGDCNKPMLGLSTADQQELQENVTIIIHAAATVRFDENLRKAVFINLIATRDLLILSNKMKHLKAFVHVSTAYSNCHLNKIEEKIYESAIDDKQLITITECLDDQQLAHLTPKLLEDCPNTYIYTKRVAESLFKQYGKGLPVIIVRPSIITGSSKEPTPGWVDNLYGPSGAVIGCTAGLLRVLECDPYVISDLIPVDMVANIIIASVWNLNCRRNKDSIEDPPVYNMVSGTQNPVTWLNFRVLGQKFWAISIFAYTLPILLFEKNKVKLNILKFFLHYLPALLIDTLAQLFGKEKRMVKMIQKVDKLSELLSYFCKRQWDFSNKNTQDLWKSLDQKDKEIFPFNVEDINWEEYFYNYMRGIRQYLLKDDLSTVPAAKKRAKWLYLSHYLLLILLIFVLGCFTWITFRSTISFGSTIVALIYDYRIESAAAHSYVMKMKKIILTSLLVLIIYIVKKYLNKYEADLPVQYISLSGGMFIFDDNSCHKHDENVHD